MGAEGNSAPHASPSGMRLTFVVYMDDAEASVATPPLRDDDIGVVEFQTLDQVKIPMLFSDKGHGQILSWNVRRQSVGLLNLEIDVTWPKDGWLRQWEARSGFAKGSTWTPAQTKNPLHEPSFAWEKTSIRRPSVLNDCVLSRASCLWNNAQNHLLGHHEPPSWSAQTADTELPSNYSGKSFASKSHVSAWSQIVPNLVSWSLPANTRATCNSWG